jgi:hypothetical protein
VKLLDGAYAESPADPEAEQSDKPESESSKRPGNGASSGSIVTTALPARNLDAA